MLCTACSWIGWFNFERWSFRAVQVGFQHEILLPQPPSCGVTCPYHVHLAPVFKRKRASNLNVHQQTEYPEDSLDPREEDCSTALVKELVCVCCETQSWAAEGSVSWDRRDPLFWPPSTQNHHLPSLLWLPHRTTYKRHWNFLELNVNLPCKLHQRTKWNATWWC